MSDFIDEALQFHEDTFYEYFLPYRHPAASDKTWGGIGLEPYGEDFNLVKTIDSNFLWTVIDGSDNPHQWIIPGIHYFNRICYLITRVPHNELSVEFMIPNRCRSLTPIGLKRQINKLDKAMTYLNNSKNNARYSEWL